MKQLNTVRVVLVNTSHPGNIGSVARAMKTMGLSRLTLVAPKIFPDVRADELAAGAVDVLREASVVESLPEALRGAQLVLATSARPRDIALQGLLPATAAMMVASFSDEVEVALVFGRESAGLTNDELLQCHYHIQIPANEVYSSLNLAQAVQIIAYEIRMKVLNPAIHVTHQQAPLASADELEGFYVHLKETLIRIGFLQLANPKRLEQRLRRLFGRVGLEKKEINILRGILKHIGFQ